MTEGTHPINLKVKLKPDKHIAQMRCELTEMRENLRNLYKVADVLTTALDSLENNLNKERYKDGK